MTENVLVLTTAGDEKEARRIAQELVERCLAACVNIVPRIHSVYRWKDKVESGEEHLLIIKSTRACITRLQAAIRELHSYELPECIVVSIEGGSPEYLNWIQGAVRSA
ncbi:MAG TPA: divalent-cation tolerance protein CutA [Terriglobales bacterium]|jgi:periplasmic divalent cation tolerance protein